MECSSNREQGGGEIQEGSPFIPATMCNIFYRTQSSYRLAVAKGGGVKGKWDLLIEDLSTCSHLFSE